MPSSCVLKESCGAQAPGWSNGQIPSREAGIVERQVCFNFRKDCCYYSLPIQVKKCSDFFVYKLKDVYPLMPGNYCFTTNTLGGYKQQYVLHAVAALAIPTLGNHSNPCIQPKIANPMKHVQF